MPGKADPIARKDLVYYGDEKKRGYLAIQARELRALAEHEAVVPEVVKSAETVL